MKKVIAALGILSPLLILASPLPNLAILLVVFLLLSGFNLTTLIILVVLAVLGVLNTNL